MTFKIIEDYETALDPKLLTDKFRELTLSRTASFYDKQFLVIRLLTIYGTAKTQDNAEALIKALLTYVREIDNQAEEELPVICTESFMTCFDRGATGFLNARMKELKQYGPSELQNKRTEWQNLCKIAGNMLEPASYAHVLYSYKEEQTLSDEDFGFCMLRLSELMVIINKRPIEQAALADERRAFLYSYLAVDANPANAFVLFKSMLQDQYGSLFVESGWECKLSDEECELFAAIIALPSVTREQWTMVVQRAKDLGAQKMREAVVLKKIPLNTYSEGHSIDEFLEILECVLTGKSTRKFSAFSDDDKQAIFLLLLAASFDAKETKSLTLLLLSIPYVVHNLQRVRLKDSLNGSEADLKRILQCQIATFYSPQADNLGSDWPSVNQVIRHVASQQIVEPIALLTRALVLWHLQTSPRPKQAAAAIKACAEFAVGLTEVGESIQDITHHLLLALASSVANTGDLSMVNVLFHLLQLDGKKLEPKGPSWTEQLEEKEIDLFSNLLTTSQLASTIYDELFTYYTREGSSEKCFQLALHIAPCLHVKQLKILIQHLNSPERRALFVKVVCSDVFRAKTRENLVAYLLTKTVDDLLLAGQISLSFTINDLTCYLEALSQKIPYSLSVTPTHKDALRELNKKPWCITHDNMIYTIADDNAEKLLTLLNTATEKMWLTDELPPTLWVQKLQQTIDMRLMERKRSPSPQPMLLPAVLRKSASPLLSREPQEVLFVHLKKSGALEPEQKNT